MWVRADDLHAALLSRSQVKTYGESQSHTTPSRFGFFICHISRLPWCPPTVSGQGLVEDKLA